MKTERILKFSGELSSGLPKVARRFITEVLYGIQARQSVRLTETARSLEEEIPLKKTFYRLSRQLGTGGLFAALEKNRNVSVYLPYSFPYDFVRRVENMKAEVISVKEPIRICKNVFSTGEMGDQIKEQSLIINTSKGLVIVTGCSHQGIVNILKKAKNIFDKKIYLVVGGFHLFRESEDEVRNIIREFKEIEVIKCGANHCTGDRAISLFKDAFGENYVQIGTGKILHIK